MSDSPEKYPQSILKAFFEKHEEFLSEEMIGELGYLNNSIVEREMEWVFNVNRRVIAWLETQLEHENLKSKYSAEDLQMLKLAKYLLTDMQE